MTNKQHSPEVHCLAHRDQVQILCLTSCVNRLAILCVVAAAQRNKETPEQHLGEARFLDLYPPDTNPADLGVSKGLDFAEAGNRMSGHTRSLMQIRS